jgi:hypothetical protein
MKRFRFLLLLVVLLSAGAAVYAKSGETKTIVDDGKTIRITREGDRTKIVVESDGKKTKEITVEGDADDDDDFDFDVPRHHRSHRIIINGRPLSEILDLPMMRGHRNDAWFVCPKDHATLRVPESKDGDSFKCPVDGTTMEKRKAPAFSVFFDNEL